MLEIAGITRRQAIRLNKQRKAAKKYNDSKKLRKVQNYGNAY